MEEKRYIISEAAERTGIESHVLRYWEEELGLDIPRNEMGHRYYTENQLQMFKRIKELKDSGFQLKAVKTVLESAAENEKGEGKAAGMMMNWIQSDQTAQSRQEPSGAEETQQPQGPPSQNPQAVQGSQEPPGGEEAQPQQSNQEPIQAQRPQIAQESFGIAEAPQRNPIAAENELAVKRSQDKLAQFEQIIGDIVTRSLTANNKRLGEDISYAVTEQVSTKVIKEMDYMMRMREEAEDERYKKLDETIRGMQKSSREAAAFRDKQEKRKKRRLFRKA